MDNQIADYIIEIRASLARMEEKIGKLDKLVDRVEGLESAKNRLYGAGAVVAALDLSLEWLFHKFTK